MTAEDFWQSKNGGKPSYLATTDNELITPNYAVILLKEYASLVSSEKDKRIAELEKEVARLREIEANAPSYADYIRDKIAEKKNV